MINNEHHLLIPKIENGIVIDHIPVGQGLRVVEILLSNFDMNKHAISVGLNYFSTSLGKKDLVKIQVDIIPEPLLHQISLICPGVSIKRIRNFNVDKKFILEPPFVLESIVPCINPNCITNNSRHIATEFKRIGHEDWIFRCSYCEKVFHIDELAISKNQVLTRRKIHV